MKEELVQKTVKTSHIIDMAAVVGRLNNYLQNTLLIGETTVQGPLNNQGLQSLDGFASLTEDDVGDICPTAH